ncbi:MAG TPA: phenylalanine--tRNA ligase subunit beta [Firmicutes bacterium]|nr:phenylalanine--tRNA ligase subunit beta [Bacillota bacterium]
MRAVPCCSVSMAQPLRLRSSSRPILTASKKLGAEIIAALELTLTFTVLRKPQVQDLYTGRDTSEVVSVEIADAEGCPRYGAIALEDVKVCASPAVVRAQLRLAGLRPINNVVDATNLVMFETGHPLHAFDLEKIENSRVIIRRASETEKIVAIDGNEYSLCSDDLVIADAVKPIAIAGVIGGENSEVTSETRNVLIEGAFFEKSLIWRTSKRLAIASEAAYRFARGVDIEAIPYVLARAAEMIQQDTGCRVARTRIDVYPGQKPPRYVVASPKRINSLLGTSIPEQEICDYLERLGFVVSPGRELEISIPTRRVDVETEADIAEEVARLYGYDRIPAAQDRASRSHGALSLRMEISLRLRRLLTGMGLTEVVTDAMVSPEVLDLLGINSDAVVIRNPVGINASVMRTMLVPGILDVLVRNEHRGEEGVAIFEVGKVYRREGDEFKETWHLALGLSGLNESRVWNRTPRDFDFFDLKGIGEAIFNYFGLEAEFEAGGSGFLHPGRRAVVRTRAGREFGLVGEVMPDIVREYGSRRRLYVAELDLEPFVEAGSIVRRMRERPKYPAVKRDIAVVVPKSVLDMQVRKIILEEGSDLIESIETFDLYEGHPIPKGKKSLAYAIVFRHPSRTLQESEIDEVQERIERRLGKELDGSLRKQT